MILKILGGILCRSLSKADVDYGLALSFAALVVFAALGGQSDIINDTMSVTINITGDRIGDSD